MLQFKIYASLSQFILFSPVFKFSVINHMVTTVFSVLYIVLYSNHFYKMKFHFCFSSAPIMTNRNYVQELALKQKGDYLPV